MVFISTQSLPNRSFVLLPSSGGYAFTETGGLDSLGAAAIAVFEAQEGRETFEKARKKPVHAMARKL